MLFFWFVVAYLTAYRLGMASGEIKERKREERAYSKAQDNITYITRKGSR